MTGLSSSAILVWLVQLLFLASLSCFVSHPNLLSLLLLIAARQDLDTHPPRGASPRAMEWSLPVIGSGRTQAVSTSNWIS